MEEEKHAKVDCRNLNVSTKMSIEICNSLRGMNIEDAKLLLNDIMEQKRALPVRRFNFDLGHKKGGIGPGSYPKNASAVFLKLLKSLQANANNKGMNTKNLVVVFSKANKGEQMWRSGSKGRMKRKNTHIELRAKEIKNDRKTDSSTKA